MVAWYRWVAAETSWCTANKVLSHLSAVCAEAQYMDLRPPQSNPCRDWKREAPTPREIVLDEDQVVELYRSFDHAEERRAAWAERWKDRGALRRVCTYSATEALRLLFLTGARRNEIRALVWGHVDLDGRVLRLPRTKTGQRVIPLCDQAIELLLRQRERARSVGLDVPWVFPARPARTGAPVSTHIGDLRVAWISVLEFLGYEPSEYRVNDMRRGFLAHALRRGASLDECAAAAGHKTTETTRRVYLRFVENPRAQRAANAFAGLLQETG